MPSKAFSPNMASRQGPVKRGLFFRRDLKENGVWLFTLSLLLILLEPFVLYLTGATAPDLSQNPLWSTDLDDYFLKFSRDLQSFLLASLLLLGISFLAYRLFAFLFNKEESSFYLSLPFSRAQLFVNRYGAGLVLISLAFLLEFLVMLLVFFLPPGNLAPYFQAWLSLKFNFYLASLAFFSSLVCSFSLVGHFADGLLTALGLNFILPLVFALLGTFVRNSVAGHFAWSRTAWLHLLSLWSPGLQLYLARAGLLEGLLTLVSTFWWAIWALVAFRRRPAERAGSRLSALPHSWPLSFLYTLLGGVLGGYFLESLLNAQKILIFLAGFLLFSCLALLLYQVMVQGALREAGRSFALKIFVSFALMLAFDLAVETYPSEAPLYWESEDVASAEFPLHPLLANWIPQEAGVDLQLDQKESPEALSALLQSYQEGPHLAERQGFINDSWRSYRRMEEDEVPPVLHSLPMIFALENGRRDKVNFYYEDIEELREILSQSPTLQDLAQLGQPLYLEGDQLFFDFVSYGEGVGAAKAFKLWRDRLAAYPYFEEFKGQEEEKVDLEGAFRTEVVTASQEASAEVSSQGFYETKQRATFLLRNLEAQQLCRLQAEAASRREELFNLNDQAKLNHEQELALQKKFRQELDRLWSGQELSFGVRQARRLELPGLYISRPLQAYDPISPPPQASDFLPAIHLEKNLGLYEDSCEECRAYVLQLLQGEAHD